MTDGDVFLKFELSGRADRGEEDAQLIANPVEPERAEEKLTPRPVEKKLSAVTRWRLWLQLICQSYLKPAKRTGIVTQPGLDYQSTLHAPYFILLVSILEVSVYVWCRLSEETESSIQRLLVYDPYHKEEVWRFLSYMLLHSSDLHLALNIAIQVLLASPLEIEQGHLRTSVVYIGGVLAGSLGTSVLEPELYMVGASGGVYALLISQLANILLNFRQLRYKIYRTFAVIVISFADIAFSIYHHFHGNVYPRIGWAAHSSGAIAGFLLGLAIFRVEQHKGWKSHVRYASWVLILTSVSAGIVWNVLHDPTVSNITETLLGT